MHNIKRMRVSEQAWLCKGWTLRQLADITGLEYQALLRWNQGRSLPRLPTFVELCRKLGCSFQDMIEL